MTAFQCENSSIVGLRNKEDGTDSPKRNTHYINEVVWEDWTQGSNILVENCAYSPWVHDAVNGIIGVYQCVEPMHLIFTSEEKGSKQVREILKGVLVRENSAIVLILDWAQNEEFKFQFEDFLASSSQSYLHVLVMSLPFGRLCHALDRSNKSHLAAKRQIQCCRPGDI